MPVDVRLLITIKSVLNKYALPANVITDQEACCMRGKIVCFMQFSTRLQKYRKIEVA